MSKPPSPRSLGIAARVAAQLAGQMHYDGQPCKQGHTRRYADSGQCVQCCTERNRARRERIRLPSRQELLEDNEKLRQQLFAALDAEARAWARVAELEDRHEPRSDPDIQPA